MKTPPTKNFTVGGMDAIGRVNLTGNRGRFNLTGSRGGITTTGTVGGMATTGATTCRIAVQIASAPEVRRIHLTLLTFLSLMFACK